MSNSLFDYDITDSQMDTLIRLAFRYDAVERFQYERNGDIHDSEDTDFDTYSGFLKDNDVSYFPLRVWNKRKKIEYYSVTKDNFRNCIENFAEQNPEFMYTNGTGFQVDVDQITYVDAFYILMNAAVKENSCNYANDVILDF